MEIDILHAVFLLVDGTRRKIEASPGQSLMLAATRNGLDDIVADCGGALACASCHVIVEPEFAQVCPPMKANESEMLEFTAAPRLENSRLSCQLVMEEKMDGIIVRIAHPQV